MGIKTTARNDFLSVFTSFVSGSTPTRAQKRKYVAELGAVCNEWLYKWDAVDNDAANGFAASKQAQFKSYLDTLSDPTIDPVNPND